MAAKMDFIEVPIKSRLSLSRRPGSSNAYNGVLSYLFSEAVDKWFGNELIFTPCKTHEFHF